MNIFIAGGGRVGAYLGRLLSGESQDVTIIESSQDKIEKIDYALDASTAVGDGASVMLLQSLGVGSADLFVASMGNDENNLIAAATAKGLGAKQVVARVDNPMYIESNILYETVLGVDYIVSPDALAALDIANYIEHPGILATQEFGRGLVHMCQIRVVKSPTIRGKTLKDVVPAGSGILLGLIDRNSSHTIPHGDAVIEPGDLVTLIGHHEKMNTIQKLFQAEETKPTRVAIMGGSTLAVRLAQALEGKVRTVKLFERREERCGKLAEKLAKAKVVCRDAASRVALEQEHIDSTDVFVAATGDDERNIMAGVLAKEVGAKRVVAIVHQPDFAPLVQRLGIDLAITPRACVANRILKIVHREDITSLALLADGKIEVVEFAIGNASSAIGRRLKDFKFPRGVLVATILRGDKVIVPSGEDEIQVGDSVILIASSDLLEGVRKVLQKKR